MCGTVRERQLTGDETLEEGLGGEISVVLLEVVLARGGELHGNELEATVLEARDDGANESTLVDIVSKCCSIAKLFPVRDGFGSNDAVFVPGHHRA